ncbi:MAG: hypothetical protein J5649_10395 [Lachnospiraceae bacterium]|nr:hypothetical protein [Lachnospiraceae bacterium]
MRKALFIGTAIAVISFFILSVTACGLSTSQDKKPADEPTKQVEATETPKVTKPVEPMSTATPTQTPTPEPTKPIEPQPVEKLTLSIEGEIHEEKLDDLLKNYEDTGEDVTVAVDFGDVSSEEAWNAFFKRYPKLDHYRVLNFDPEVLLLKIPYPAAKELTKDDAVKSITMPHGYPDNEMLLSQSVTVEGTIDGKNVYDALHDPRYGESDLWIFSGVQLKGWLSRVLMQMNDDEYIRIAVSPSLHPELIDALLEPAWKESGTTDKQGWLLTEEAKKIKGEIITELTVDVYQSIYDAGWIVTKEEEDKYQPAYRFIYAIVTKKQLEDISIPEDATYGYEVYFEGAFLGKLRTFYAYYGIEFP